MENIKSYSGSTWICTLPEAIQESIKVLLEGMGLDEEDVQAGMNGRLNDLADTIQES